MSVCSITVNYDGAAYTPVYTYMQTVLADSPTLYWQLNETSGTTAHDSSGNGYNGTYNGSIVLGKTGPSVIIPVSAGFTGSSAEYITEPQTWNLTTFTEELWVNTSQVSGLLLQFSSVQGPGCASWDRMIALNSTGQLYTPSNGPVTSPNPINDGKWYHCVVTYTPTEIILYINGQQVSTSTSAGVQNYNGYLNIATGCFNSTWAYFSGQMAQLALYSSVLTPDRVLAHYNAGVL
jgi:hypothetical protein